MLQHDLIGLQSAAKALGKSAKGLSERPDFLDIYHQYLSYVRNCPDIWFATERELYQYWTRESPCSANRIVG